MDSTLSDSMKAFHNSYAMYGLGFFGSSPHRIGRVLKNAGIHYEKVNCDQLNKIGVYIISYWNSDNIFKGLHTVAVKFDGEYYYTYNLSEGEVFVGLPANYINGYICGYYLGS